MVKQFESDTEHSSLDTDNDGIISDNKGVNIPDIVLPIESLTNKDKSDLQKVLEMGVDWVALSFVQLSRLLT